MKKTSQMALGASVLFFLAAGMVKFWPEERFFPRPTLSPANVSVASPLQVLGPSAQDFSRNQGLLPPWLRRNPGNHTAPLFSPGTPGTLSGKTPVTLLPAASVSAAPDKKEPMTKGVSLAAQNMPVGDVLAQVFHRAGVPFSLPGRLREPVNIIFVDAPLSQALDQTLSLTTKPHLTYHKEDGVYIVVADDSYTPPMPAQFPAPAGGYPATGFRQGVF